MTAYTWTGAAGDGSFNTAANWSPNGVPGASDTVTINTNAAATITVSTNDAVQGLTLGKLDTLAVSSGETLTIGSSAASTLSVAGTLSLNSTGYNSALVVGGPSVTLNGAGTILLGNGNDNNIIVAGTAGDQFVNVNDKIVGAGQIGAGTALAFTNDAGGLVNASASNQLIINTGSLTASNAGIFEATKGSGGLVLQTAINDGTTGRIQANGGNVFLNGATILGGTLSSTAGSSVQVESHSTLDGTAHQVTNAGSLVVNTGETLSVLGTLNNTGVLSLQSTGYDSDVVFGATGTLTNTVTLTGGGSIVLGDANAANRLYGGNAGDTLVNLNNTISGSGTIGAGQLNLVNDGTISATGTANALYIQTTSLQNNGLLEAAGPQGLILQSVIDDAGTATILSAGGTVQLNGATITGGMLESSGGGSFAVTSQSTLQNLSNFGTVEVNTGETLTLLGTITNDGTIGLNSSGYDSDLVVGSPTVTLTGGGTIQLTDNNTADRIYGASGTNVLDNVNNLIEGSGQIGAGQLTLVNGAAGVIDATGANNQLVISTGSVVTNDGLIESTGAAGLALQSIVSNATGTILAASSTIYLNGGDVQGGLLTSTGTGVFSANGQTTIDGSANAVVLKGALEVATGSTMTLLGTITNEGTIGLNSVGYDSDLIVGNPTVTLTGGGTIQLTDNNTADRIYGASGANVLDNVNNFIEGSGQIGAGQLTLVNGTAGVIDATGASNQLVISTGSVVTNDGLIESTGAAGLALQSTVSNATGTILAASTIYLNGGDVQGGLLLSTGTGDFSANGQTTIDGSAHAVVLKGALEVATGSTMTVLGTITNEGTIGLNSTGYDSDLVINSPTLTLNGGGILALSDANTADRIYGVATADVLDNVNNTIEGSGQIGAGQLTLVNAGTISSTGTSGLTISLGSTGTNTATGKLLGVGTGGLAIQNGTYTNAGLIQADDGSNVTFSNGATLTNDSAAGVLTGGTYATVASGDGATLSVTGAAVKTLSADLILSGAGASVSFGGTAIEASLTTIAARAQLQVLGDRSYTTTLGISNAGTILLGGGDLTSKLLNDRATSLLSGFGTLAGGLASAGTLSATGGTLDLTGRDTITGTVTGTGTLCLDDNRFTLADTAPITVSEIALINRASLAISDSLTYAGVFDIAGVSSLTGTGTFTSTGLFEQTGRGTATVADPFSNSGTILTVSGGTLAFTGGLANTGLVRDNGGFNDTAALTGGALSIGARGSSAMLASANGAANSTVSTLTIGGGTLNTSSTTLTVAGDYVNTAAGTGNTYNAFAGVTGTIDGQGTQLSVVGVNGTTIQDVNGTLTIAVAAGHAAYFEVENTGAAGSAALRGALQTTVNGGTINGRDLSGSGVTAGNFGPIAAGSASGTYVIDYKGGAISNEAIHLTSDFANVAGLTIDIVAQTGSAEPATSRSLPTETAHQDWFVLLHHG